MQCMPQLPPSMFSLTEIKLQDYWELLKHICTIEKIQDTDGTQLIQLLYTQQKPHLKFVHWGPGSEKNKGKERLWDNEETSWVACLFLAKLLILMRGLHLALLPWQQVENLYPEGYSIIFIMRRRGPDAP